MAEFTGRKFLAVVVACFGVIIAVNGLMAYKALSTFPGMEVANSYVASQSFDADKAAQLGLGWSLTADYDSTAKTLRLNFTDTAGQPASVANVKVLVGRTTEASDDQHPDFLREAGVFVAPVDLAPGKWMLQVDAFAADGTRFRQRIDLMVKG